MERLLRFIQAKQGGNAVNGNGRGNEQETRAFIDVPEPSAVFGSYAGRIILDANPPKGPSPMEIRNRPLLDAAAEVQDPWADSSPDSDSARK